MIVLVFTGKAGTTRVGDRLLEPGDQVPVPEGDVDVWTRGPFEVSGPVEADSTAGEDDFTPIGETTVLEDANETAEGVED